MRTEKRFGSIGVGATSIVLIAVVLCLTIFSVLALVTANADAKLSKKSLRSIGDYYAAEAKAQEKLAAIDGRLVNGDIEASGDMQIENGQIVFSVSIDDARELCVVLERTGKNAPRYEILSYQVVSVGEWKGDQIIDVY